MLVVVQYPDFFGRIYDYTQLISDAHGKGALVCVVTNPTALALLKTPGAMDADIVVGDGQPLGIPMWYGGPTLGLLHDPQEPRAQDGRQAGRRDRGQPRSARLRAHADRPRTAHQARACHLEHLHQPGAPGPGRGGLPFAAGTQRAAPGCRTVLPQGALCGRTTVGGQGRETVLRTNLSSTSLPCASDARRPRSMPTCWSTASWAATTSARTIRRFRTTCSMAVTEMNTKEEIDLLADVLSEISHD